MNEPSRNIKKLLSVEEKEKLRFTKEDRERVFQKVEEYNARRKIRPVKILLPVAVVIIAFGLLLQMSMTQKVLAQIPFINSLFSQYGDEGQKKAVKIAEVQHIEQTAEDNGINVTVHEILYDGARISVSYSIEATAGKYEGKNLDIFLFNMKVDGKDVPGYGFSGGSNDKKIGNRYVKVQNIDLDKDLPNKFTLNLSIQELLLGGESGNKTIKGNWAFSLPVKKTGGTYEFTPTVSKKTDLAELKVPKIVFAPSGTLVEIDCEQPPVLDDDYSSISFDIFDSNNKILKVLSGGGSCIPSNKTIGKGTIKVILEPLKEIPESITIQSYFNARNDLKTSIINITEKLPIFLPSGENGGILINKIEKKQGEVWVYYDVKGGFEKIRKEQFDLYRGKELLAKNKIEKQGQLHNSESKNLLVKFKTPYSEDLNFVSSSFFVVKPIKELELKIPINEEELVKQESEK